MAILIYSPGSYWFIPPRKFHDGEINRWIIEIKRGDIKKVLFENFQNSLSLSHFCIMQGVLLKF